MEFVIKLNLKIILKNIWDISTYIKLNIGIYVQSLDFFLSFFYIK